MRPEPPGAIKTARPLGRGQALLVLLSGFALLGCHDPRSRAEKTLSSSDVRTLRHDAAVLYKDLFAPAAKAPFVPVPPETLPRSMRAFTPRRALAYPDGIALVLEPLADRESGLYIVPEGMDHQPTAGPRATFRQLRTGIYWYDFGRTEK